MAAGTIVPVEFRTATKLHRFWITSADRGRLEELREDDSRLPPPEEESARGRRPAARRPSRPAGRFGSLRLGHRAMAVRPARSGWV
jgi:hypothetical protein